ncbi:MAG: class I SAM-dependent methyltransferase [Acidimicrobiales bacterium]
MTVHPAAAAGFANTAEDYERTRPSYPAAAIEHLVDVLGLAPGRTVVDVAAGTGKLTRLLVPSGATVVAVEPVAEMRAVLEREVPLATALEGTAEALAVHHADAITVAQAFHWFDGPAALASFARVLGTNGHLAIVYNERDESPGWVADVNAITRRFREDVPQREDGTWKRAFADTSLFTALETVTFDNPHVLSPADALARFRSLSFVGCLPGDEQAQVLAQIAAILASHPDTRGCDEVVIPQRTTVSVCAPR